MFGDRVAYLHVMSFIPLIGILLYTYGSITKAISFDRLSCMANVEKCHINEMSEVLYMIIYRTLCDLCVCFLASYTTTI